MSDFLVRLAGRTLGAVDTVRPVLAPVFAPQSAAADVRADEAVDDDLAPLSASEEGLPASRRDWGLAKGTAVDTGGMSQPERAFPQRTPAAPRAAASADAAARTPDGLQEPQPSSTPSVREAEASRASTPGGNKGDLDVPPTESATTVRPRISASSHPATLDAFDGDAGAHLPAASASNGRDLAAETGAAATSLLTFQDVRAAGRVPPPLVRTIAPAGASPASLLSAASLAIGPPTAASVAPTIKITIGRVEVRAVPAAAAPAAPPRRGRAEQPTLSLRDYLLRGGQR